jgi:hypothetical protein
MPLVARDDTFAPYIAYIFSIFQSITFQAVPQLSLKNHLTLL